MVVIKIFISETATPTVRGSISLPTVRVSASFVSKTGDHLHPEFIAPMIIRVKCMAAPKTTPQASPIGPINLTSTAAPIIIPKL